MRLHGVRLIPPLSAEDLRNLTNLQAGWSKMEAVTRMCGGAKRRGIGVRSGRGMTSKFGGNRGAGRLMRIGELNQQACGIVEVCEVP